MRVQTYADSRGISFYDALKEAQQIMTIGKSYTKLEPFVTMIQVFRSKLEFYSLEDLIKDIIETTGYLKELELSNDENAEDRIANIEELISKVVAYEEIHEKPTLGDFLEEIALVSDLDRVKEDDNKVLLMTLHSAKGLEFPHVYLAGLEDNVFPSYRAIMSDDKTDLEEERRLAYVGITRAREELTITCARKRMTNGETNFNPVSCFVKEIPDFLLDQKLPSRYSKEFVDYEEDSYERTSFKTKPFQTNGFQNPQSASSTSYQEKQSSNSSYTSQYSSKYTNANKGISASEYFATKPKAVLKKAATAMENKPFIAKGIGEVVQSSELNYGVGDRIKHIKYGQGEVLQIEQGARDFQVTVNFDGVGNKIMYAAFAKLQKL